MNKLIIASEVAEENEEIEVPLRKKKKVEEEEKEEDKNSRLAALADQIRSNIENSEDISSEKGKKKKTLKVCTI